jgi:hypothetical protein
MSSTLFSKPVVTVDIPEVKIIGSQFNYSFFTADERAVENTDFAATPSTPAKQQTIRTAPRYVTIDFNPGTPSLIAETPDEQAVSIKNNLDKIMLEHDFSNLEFTAVNLQDTGIDNKLSQLLSGALSIKLKDKLKSPSKIPSIPTPALNSNFEQSSLLDVAKLLNDLVGVEQKIAEAAATSNDEAGFIFIGDEKKEIKNVFSGIKKTSIPLQLNNKVAYDILRTVINDPQTIYSDEFISIISDYKNLQDEANKSIQEVDIQTYDAIVKFISTLKQDDPDPPFRHKRKIVGYVADKIEITNDGYVEKEPVVQEIGNSTQVFDPRVRYGATYMYQVRTIALVSFEAVQLGDNQAEEIYTVSALVSSKPSQKIMVKCIEEVPPPPPADFKVSWDYNFNKPRLTWNFPVNPQQDVKKFQIFRRRNISEPFQLIKQYDFDNSTVKTPSSEIPDAVLVEPLAEPKTYYIDFDFNKGNDTYIYALCCIDAHAQSSNYSIQFEVSFDTYKNKVVQKLISFSGAPKSLPNLFLQQDAFIDTIKVSGIESVKVYFEPETYEYFSRNDQGFKHSIRNLLSTNILTDGGENYILQLINTDLQEQRKIKINILDERQ